MSSAHFSRREQSRFCRVAHSPKAADDFGKSQIDVALNIFGEHCARTDLVDDPRDFGPEVTRIRLTPAFSGRTERLAGVAGREDIHAIAPRAAIEGSQVVPDRCLIQGRVCHPGHESGRGVGFPLDVANSAIGRFGDGKAELETAISGA